MSASRLLPFVCVLLAGPLAAQGLKPAPWSFSVSAGPVFGGPMGALEDLMIAQEWTGQYCDFRQSDCHQSPTPGGMSFQFSGSLARRLSGKLELKAVVEVGDLGQIIGAKDQREIKASWKTSSLGTALVLHPIPRVRLGAGPLIALLTRQTVPPAKNNSVHTGFLVEGGLRSSERASSFLELVVSYRRLPRLPEGPWPGSGQSSQIIGGPTGFIADFSHVTVGLGGGVRF